MNEIEETFNVCWILQRHVFLALQKKKKHHIFSDSALQLADDIFTVAVDYDMDDDEEEEEVNTIFISAKSIFRVRSLFCQLLSRMLPSSLKDRLLCFVAEFYFYLECLKL